MENNIISKNSTGKIILFLFVSIITLFLLVSIFDVDKTVSEKENRKLEPMPKFSISALFSGDFINKFETHYSDTFPFRDFFLNVNSKISRLTSQFSAGGDDIIIIDSNKTEDDFGGESLDDVKDTE